MPLCAGSEGMNSAGASLPRDKPEPEGEDLPHYILVSEGERPEEDLSIGPRPDSSPT